MQHFSVYPVPASAASTRFLGRWDASQIHYVSNMKLCTIGVSILNPVSNFAPKDWYEATTMCAAEGKVLCGVDEPCSGSGCKYDHHYQWTGEECRAGDAGLPAACASA